MKIVIALGNPGIEYKKTRHNFGFLFLSYLEEKYNFNIEKKKLDSLIGECNIAGEKVVFAKPTTYMNLSGNAAIKLKNWYKVDNKDIIIIFDDIDIAFGEVKYRASGSGGTHKGMQNIVQILNSSEISRIKLGIGELKHPNQEISDFVLQNFSQTEQEKFETIFTIAEKKLLEFLDK